MKKLLRTKWSTLLVAVTVMLSSSVAWADDPKPKPRRHAKAAEADAVTRSTPRRAPKGTAPIPTSDGRNSHYVKGRAVGGANGPEYSVPTGSNIPRRYNRRGYTTDSDRNSFIYDQNDQRLRSHNNLSEGLRDVPGVRVSGPRGL